MMIVPGKSSGEVFLFVHLEVLFVCDTNRATIHAEILFMGILTLC